jgi:hypothetical protein
VLAPLTPEERCGVACVCRALAAALRPLRKAAFVAAPRAPATPEEAFPVLALPAALLEAVLTRAPADARLRCAAACVAFRAALSPPHLWRALDLSETSGVCTALSAPATAALLHAAARRARAAGGLTSLDVSGCASLGLRPLRAALAANAASLTHLRVHATSSGAYVDIAAAAAPWRASAPLQADDVRDLLSAAGPALRRFHTDMRCANPRLARRLLARAQPAFAPLRVRTLHLQPLHYTDPPDAVELIAEGMRAHDGLRALEVAHGVRLDAPPGTWDAVADAAVACGLSALVLHDEVVLPAAAGDAAPPLARLLARGALRELRCDGGGAAALFADGEAVACTCAALRANAMLTSLHLQHVRVPPAAFASLLRAVTAHATLTALTATVLARPGGDAEWAHDGALRSVGDALCALIAANARPLTALHLAWGGRLPDEPRAALRAALRAHNAAADDDDAVDDHAAGADSSDADDDDGGTSGASGCSSALPPRFLGALSFARGDERTLLSAAARREMRVMRARSMKKSGKRKLPLAHGHGQ